MNPLYVRLRRAISALNLQGLKRQQIRLKALALNQRGFFKDVQTYCMFIGYPRSGHSLVGSLIDAHPDMIIAHELDSLGMVYKGCTRSELFTALLDNSEYYANFGREWTGYSYIVPGQWQGRFRRLSVIGDKKGGQSTLWILQHPELLDKLRNLLSDKIAMRVVHVVRNPFDNISTIARRDNFTIPFAVENQARLLSGVDIAMRYFADDEMLTLRHEDLIRAPRETLTQIIHFLGHEAPDDYLDACTSILFEKPRQTRAAADWQPEDIERVQAMIERYPWLAGYTAD